MILRILSYTARNYYYLYNRLKLKIHGIKFQDNIKINGKFYIQNDGMIEMGNNIYINSSIASNMLGGSSFSSLVTSKNASIKIGNNVGISNSSITAHKEIVIEDNVLIGNGCKIFDTDFHSININSKKIEKQKVLIEKNAFIGANSVILKGVTIGENSVIGANSVVSRSIPSNEIWAGNPAKKIKGI